MNYFVADYVTSVSNHPFLLNESLTVAKLFCSGYSWEALRAEVVEHNALQTRSPRTAKSYWNALRFRLHDIPAPVLTLLAENGHETARMVLFYILLHKSRLLREFMGELVRDRRLLYATQLTAFEVARFADDKREQSETLLAWSDSTWRKFWQNTLRLPIEAGLLGQGPPWQIQPGYVPLPLREWLQENGDTRWLPLMLDEGVLT